MTGNDHHDIRLMLQAIDEIMPTTKYEKRPKVLLFDIGGVCVSFTDETNHVRMKLI